jgi:hypothetical protein
MLENERTGYRFFNDLNETLREHIIANILNCSWYSLDHGRCSKSVHGQ